MTPPTSHLLIGDCLDVLPTLEAGSVSVCVTSPPYWSLRSYLDSDHPDKARELGSEAQLDCLGAFTGNPCGACWICHMVEVMRGVWRVLRDDGTCWVNVGDSYAHNRTEQVPDSKHRDVGNNAGMQVPTGLKPKDLCLQPYRLALALQADGWYVRSHIIWHKPAPMPESVRDRPTSAHETVWLLSKRATYWYDADAVREKGEEPLRVREDRIGGTNGHKVHHSPGGLRPLTGTRNLRNVWTINPEPFPDAHFATYPTALVRPCILAGTSAVGCCPHCGAGWRRVVERTRSWRDGAETREQAYPTGSGNRTMRPSNGGMSTSEYEQVGWQPGCDCPHTREDCVPATVLDPFCGSGTTGLVCAQYGRSFVGIELSEEYAEMARRRIAPALTQPCLEVTP